MIVWIVAAAALGLAAGWWLTRAAARRATRTDAAAALRRTLLRSRTEADERERIYRDLHDDIGAKLLDLALTADDPRHADLARSILQDLRDVVSRSRGAPGTLQAVLDEIRAECEQRLDAFGVALRWQADDALPDPQLGHAESLHLYRIVREALTNALKHARPAAIRVRVVAAGGELLIDVTDEGGDAPATIGGGRGTENMVARAEALQGSIHWTPGTQGGTKVVLKVPLPD